MAHESIEFVKKRDGDKAAVLFAKQAMVQYRRQALKYGLKSLVNGRNILLRYKDAKAYYLQHKELA